MYYPGILTLVIVSIFVIFMIFKYYYQSHLSKKDVKVWPPHISKCPEYWNVDAANPSQCKNETNRNIASDFNSDTVDIYNGNNKDTLKNMQGTSYKHWDGISNM